MVPFYQFCSYITPPTQPLTSRTGRHLLHDDVRLDVVLLEQLQLPRQVVLGEHRGLLVLPGAERLVRHHYAHPELPRSGG